MIKNLSVNVSDVKEMSILEKKTQLIKMLLKHRGKKTRQGKARDADGEWQRKRPHESGYERNL